MDNKIELILNKLRDQLEAKYFSELSGKCIEASELILLEFKKK